MAAHEIPMYLLHAAYTEPAPAVRKKSAQVTFDEVEEDPVLGTFRKPRVALLPALIFAAALFLVNFVVGCSISRMAQRSMYSVCAIQLPESPFLQILS